MHIEFLQQQSKTGVAFGKQSHAPITLNGITTEGKLFEAETITEFVDKLSALPQMLPKGDAEGPMTLRVPKGRLFRRRKVSIMLL